MTELPEIRTRYCPACEQLVAKPFRPGPGRRPEARCPHCRSLERHRFLAILLDCLRPAFGDVGTLLDIAPTPISTPLLQGLQPRRLVRLDLGLDNRAVDVLGSLTALPLASGSVDLLVCYHVLEHVPDDRRAMEEIRRVLAPGGIALLQVPWRPGVPTDEDVEATTEERRERFGQADHVRLYGDDFEDRLHDVGLELQRVTPRQLLGERAVSLIRASPDESVWIGRPAGSPPVVLHLPQSLRHMIEALFDQRARDEDWRETVRDKMRLLRRRNHRLRERNHALREELRGRSPIRTTSELLRLMRSLGRRVPRRARD